MSAEVLIFPGCPAAAERIEGDAQRVVEVLNSALAHARTGNYFAVGIVLVAENGSEDIDTSRWWDTTARAPQTRLVAGLHMLVADIAAGRSQE